MAGTNRLLDAALEIQEFCHSRRWRFCFIGGIAVQHWGESRLTRDADVELFTGVGDEARYVDALLGGFEPRMPDAREFALAHRVLLLRAANGVPIDLTLGALPFEEKAVGAAQMQEIVAGVRLRLATPGALLVFKAFADRAQDWLDISGILAKSGRLIDWNEVDADLRTLLELKGDSRALERLEGLRAENGGG